MPVYLCRVADDSGKVEQFLREAASEESCLREISTHSHFVLFIREVTQSGRGAARRHRLSRKSLTEVTDLLALMLGSGLSLKDALEVAQGIFTRGESNNLVTLLLERIRKGGTLAGALRGAAPGIPSFYVGMVRIGERIGTLDQVFARLSIFLKEDKALRDRFTSALIYPAIVLSVACISAVFIVVFLFPRLREIFSQLGPGMADHVQSLMGSLNAGLIIIGALLVLAAAGGVAIGLLRGRGGRTALRIDALVLRLPLAAQVLMQRELLNFTFAMEAMTAAGVSVEDALPEGAGAISNRALGQAVYAVRDRLLKGERLSTAFSGSPVFPGRIARWMAVGERIGHVDKVFSQLRAYYQQEVEKWIARLMSVIEPALIVGLGILIVLFVVFFIVPIFSLYGTIL